VYVLSAALVNTQTTVSVFVMTVLSHTHTLFSFAALSQAASVEGLAASSFFFWHPLVRKKTRRVGINK
jgi:hypothetical protein